MQNHDIVIMLKTLKAGEVIKDKNSHHFTFGQRWFSGGFW
jgi:hypothetical protein